MTMNKSHDVVATYDVMREAAVRLMAEYAQRVTVGGSDDEALAAMRAVRARARAVDTHSIPAQLEATADFRAERDQLRLE